MSLGLTYDYVASPYSHESPLIREERYLRVSHYVALCLRGKEWVYSPIVHCHELAKTWDMPKDAGFWLAYNRAMLANARRLRILRLDGWHQSKGVMEETDFAIHNRIPYIYV